LKPLEEKRFFLSRVVRTVKPGNLDCDRLPQEEGCLVDRQRVLL
jgi:hypothetical protein